MAYVYSHIRKDNGKCFYIGKGTGNRAFSTHSRNRHWNFVVNKCGYDVKILVDGITDDKALELERDFISQVGLKDLTNMQDGGSGGFSEELRAKALTKESRAKAVANTDWIALGKKLSKMKKGIIKPELQATNVDRRKPVEAINIKTGVTKVYESQSAAGKTLGIPQNYINAVVKGKQLSTKGYKFKNI